MYRVIRSTHILVRRHPAYYQTLFYSRTQVLRSPFKRYQDQERDPCPPKLPPCPPPPKKRTLLWTTLFLLALTAGATVAAKQSPEIRDWLTINAPWFDEWVAAVYQENKRLPDSLNDFIHYSKGYIESMLPPKECSEDGMTFRQALRSKEETPKEEPPKLELPKQLSPKKEEVTKAEEEGEERKFPLGIATKDICVMENCLKELEDDIYNNYLCAKDACVYYNELVKNSMKEYDWKVVEELEKEKRIRIELVEQSNKNISASEQQIDDLMKYIDCAMELPEARIGRTKKLLQQYQDKNEAVRIDYERENQRALQRDKQVQMVVDYMNKYMENITALFPEVDFHAEKPNLKGDMDFYLLLTQKYLDSLKSQVQTKADQMIGRARRSVSAMESSKECLKPPDPTEKKKKGEPLDLIPSKIRAAYAKAKEELAKEMADRDEAIINKNDKELEAVLQKDNEEFEKNLEEKLAEREQEVKLRFDKIVAEKVKEQKDIFEAEIHSLRQQLRAVEEKVYAKKKAEKQFKRAQDLYEAGMALLGATRRGEPYVNVNKELKAIMKASETDDGNDTLVVTVLSSIPAEVWDKGIVPECVLRYNYRSMEDVAKKVAMVEGDGSPLPVYALSWVQAQLLGLIPVSSIPQGEIENPFPEPFDGLDTFDLLQRASYYVVNGNLGRAMRYVDSLQGASRVAAETWHHEATNHLQTRQAAEAVVAHAAALSLQYL